MSACLFLFVMHHSSTLQKSCEISENSEEWPATFHYLMQEKLELKTISELSQIIFKLKQSNALTCWKVSRDAVMLPKNST